MALLLECQKLQAAYQRWVAEGDRVREELSRAVAEVDRFWKKGRVRLGMQRYLREEEGGAQDWSSAVAMAFSGKGSPRPSSTFRTARVTLFLILRIVCQTEPTLQACHDTVATMTFTTIITQIDLFVNSSFMTREGWDGDRFVGPNRFVWGRDDNTRSTFVGQLP
jgi:hypothetical protein